MDQKKASPPAKVWISVSLAAPVGGRGGVNQRNRGGRKGAEPKKERAGVCTSTARVSPHSCWNRLDPPQGVTHKTATAAATFDSHRRTFPVAAMKPLTLVLLSLLFLSLSWAGVNKRRPRSAPARGQNETRAENKAAENPCEAVPLDFVFVIDSSRSIRPNDYEKVKTFIVNLIRFLEIGPDATRVGLLQYGSVVKPEFSLNAFATKAEVEQAVRNMRHLATGTMTGLAIRYAMETSFTEEDGARPAHLHIPRIAMIVTDGRPQDTVEEVAAQARQAGIQIFAIGVGRVDMKTLKTIGSEPHGEHVHLVANFSQIETLISVFRSKLCGGAVAAEMCELVDHQCQHVCVSSPTSYRCKCREGFTLDPDGKTCKADDSCAAADHGCHHFCANLADGYECRCRLGYLLSPDLRTCIKIDFCDLGDHGCQHDCFSTPESYFCRCKRGYVLNPDGRTCSEADPCADGAHGCQQESVNSGGSCACRCRSGFRLEPDGKTCERIDHCAGGNHGCEQEFSSTEDACVCGCRDGFTLRPDGKTCKKTDPCAEGAHGCEQDFVSAGESCVCRCRAGFSLRTDGRTCQSVDVCQTLEHGCQHQCISTADSYVCRCSEGFVLGEDGKRCTKAACSDGVLDLVFVIDGSKSMGPANFELVKRFVMSIVESLNVSRTGSRVGLVQYSTKVRTEFALGQHTSARAVGQAVSRMQYMGRGSMTGSALRHMFQFSFSAKEGARPHVPHVSIVFTDGRSQDDVSEWANKAKNSGVTIYAVGVGKAIEQELREIASEPEERHLYYAQDFKDMGEISQRLKSRMCADKPSDEDMCRCESMIAFQNQVTEKLNVLVQSLEAMTTRLEALENKSVLH